MNLRPDPAEKAILIGTDDDFYASPKSGIEVSPRSCHLIGLPMPENVEGGVIYEALEDPNWHLRT